MKKEVKTQKQKLSSPLTFKEKMMMRVMLLGVWFVKNISMLLYTAVVVCLLLTVFSFITADKVYFI